MDLDLWDCFGRKKICLISEEIRYCNSPKIEELSFSGQYSRASKDADGMANSKDPDQTASQGTV